MSKSFEIHFDGKGNVLINNIKGVDPNNTECVQLTKPFVDRFDGNTDMVMLKPEEQILNNHETETS